MKRIVTSLLLSLAAVCFCGHPAGVDAARPTKVVFISGIPSHGPMSHEHRAGNLLLAKALNSAGLNVNAVVLPENGYPKDPARTYCIMSNHFHVI